MHVKYAYNFFKKFEHIGKKRGSRGSGKSQVIPFRQEGVYPVLRKGNSKWLWIQIRL